MAKSDFICKICKKVKGPEVSRGGRYRYECPKHKHICEEHVNNTWFSGSKCKECDSLVIRSEFNSKSGKWMKV